MREFRLHPFERNRYFSGKTLTVRDFKAEQEYLNQKRWMLNLLTNGKGILYGLQVSKEDGEVVKVNPGIALDSNGHEIVVGMPVSMRISEVDGAPTGGLLSDKDVYLCLKYYDDEKEPVQTAAGYCQGCGETVEYNRVREKYKFFIRDAGDISAESTAHILMKTEEIFNNSGFKVTRTVPKWVNPNELFAVRLTVERLSKGAYTKVVINEGLSRNFIFNDDNNSSVALTFSEDEKENVKVFEYYARAVMDPLKSVDDDHISGSVKLIWSTQGREYSYYSKPCFIKIIESPVSREIIKEYFKDNEWRLEDSFDEGCVPLAVLRLTLNKQSLLGFNINEVVAPPHNQYVYNNPFLYELISDLETRLNAQKYPLEIKKTSAVVERPNPGSASSAEVHYDQPEKHLRFDFKFPKEMATGVIYFDIESKVLEPGDNGISEIIYPGLGAGPIYVQAEWEECRYRESAAPRDSILFGVYPNHKDGTFRIWYKVMKTVTRLEKREYKIMHKLHFRWWAYTNVFDKGETAARSFVITPKRSRVAVEPDKETSCRLIAKFNGEEINDITWEVGLDKSNGLRPNVSIKNGVVAIPKNTKARCFTVKGIYDKGAYKIYDTVVIEIVKKEVDGR